MPHSPVNGQIPHRSPAVVVHEHLDLEEVHVAAWTRRVAEDEAGLKGRIWGNGRGAR